MYAHIARQADRPGYLAVQYWLFWYYNDWNDRHESDWEFIQVLFKAETVQEALGESPVSVGYAQHTGGETAEWNDPKLEKEGSHPVVYSSQLPRQLLRPGPLPGPPPTRASAATTRSRPRRG